MSTNKDMDSMATAAMLEQIESIERKVKLMKQYINPEIGTVDMRVFSGLWLSANDCMETLRDLSIKFL